MFSSELLDQLQAEAASLGIKGATAISLAVRADLKERKAQGKVPDERSQTYWAQFVGSTTITDEPVQFEGLRAVWAAVAEMGLKLTEEDLKACRVTLARKGVWERTVEGFQHVLKVSLENPNA